MKGSIISTLINIVGTAIATILIVHITKDTVELEYYLTDPIPLVVEKGEVKESVQQLTVLNSGQVTIESIGIKIKGSIREANLVKNFANDEVTQNINKTSLQAKYNTLPPNSKFSYTIKPTTGRVSDTDIEIIHSNGKAVNALAPTNSESVLITIYAILTLGFIIYAVISFFIVRKENKLKLSNYKDILTVLNESKPFFIKQQDWDKVRKVYIESKRGIKSFHCSNLEEDESYKILNSSKPEKVSEYEWGLLKDTMVKHFEDLYLYSVKKSFDTESLNKIILVEKPIHFLKSKWQNLINAAYDELLSINNLKIPYYDTSPGPVASVIKNILSENINNDTLKKYEKALKDKYCAYILVSLSEGYHYGSVSLSEFDMTILNEREKEKIENFAYKLNFANVQNITSIYDAKSFLGGDNFLQTLQATDYKFLNEKDSSKLEEVAKAYIKLETDINTYEKLLVNIRKISAGSPLGEKPEEIDDDNWSKLKNIENKLIGLASKNKADMERIRIDEKEVCRIKEKVCKQLSIISDVLSYPRKVSEIEDYDNPFAEGNFKNLKKVAEILATNNK
ncbi:hypothetical protein AN391_03917 [Pseudoalteromonas sp. P1-13-1a]|uniref:hypothetical protein n=1 Tax=Pseudoalteromonas sp. P1-13-1a TaxID=1723756 RepID=UPI0006D6887E|nr:hypothetical protein [Pseudoalteromonas sp. P1-13-1a]KPZ51762.1 hypothetical protein AN391_03917 [Pseudoalteromonas sp. P1-13-1a]